MQPLYHVSSAANRASIAAHGLDWTRMGAAPGIAGSAEPEVAGVFLGDEEEVGIFLYMNNTGGPVDVWEVTGIAADDLVDNGSGFSYFPARIPAAQITLVSWPQAAPAVVPDGGRREKKKQQKKKPRKQSRAQPRKQSRTGR